MDAAGIKIVVFWEKHNYLTFSAFYQKGQEMSREMEEKIHGNYKMRKSACISNGTILYCKKRFNSLTIYLIKQRGGFPCLRENSSVKNRV